MATENEALVLKIRADIKSLQAGLRQAAREASAAGTSMRTNLEKSGVSKVLDGIARGAAAAGKGLFALGIPAAAAGAGLLAATNRALEFAGQLSRLSDRTGVNVETLQELKYAAEQNGAEFDEVTGALEKYTRKLGEAQAGDKLAIASFDALRVSVTNADGTFRNSEQVLSDVIATLERIEDPATRGAYAIEVFGKQGLAIAQIAQGGAGSVDKLREELRSMGGVLSNDVVRAGDAAGDALDRLKTVINAGIMKAVLTAAPQIEEFVNTLLADPQKMQETINKIVEAGGAILRVGGAALEAAGYVADFILNLGSALGEGAARAVVGSDNMVDKLNNELARLETIRTIEINASIGDVDTSKVDAEIARLTNELASLEAKRRTIEINASMGDVDTSKIDAEIARIKAELRSLSPERGPSTSPSAVVAPKPAPPPKQRLDLKPLGSDESAKARAKERANELAEQKKHNAALIQQTQELIATETALEEMRYQTRRAALMAINAEEFGGTEKKNRLIEGLAADHQARIAEIEQAERERQGARIEADMQYAAEREANLLELESLLLDSEQRQLIAEQDAFSARVAQLATFTEAELEAMGGYYEVREGLERDHQARMAQIREDALNSGLSFLTSINDRSLRSAADTAASALQIASTFSKKAFQANKVLAIADATINTYKAVANAFASAPWPYNYAAAAAALAYGLANVQAIRNTNFGGGGASGAVAGAGNPNNTTQPGDGGVASPQISLTLNGSVFSANDVRALIESINEALADGATLNT